MLRLIPGSGLCNRLLAIDSAVALAQAWNRPLKVYWRQGSNLRANFADLFAPIKDVAVDEHFRLSLRLFMMERPMWTFFYRPIFAACVRDFRNCHAITVSRFNEILHANRLDDLRAIEDVAFESVRLFYPVEKQFTIFKPRDDLQKKIEIETRQFSARTIGVHVRRTDNVLAIAASPLELFISAMQREIDTNNETTFFVASDSVQAKKDLVARFGERVLTLCDEPRRDTVAGMQHAVVELFTLARTQKILGSFYSTFTSTASQISQIPLEIIMRAEPLPQLKPGKKKWF